MVRSAMDGLRKVLQKDGVQPSLMEQQQHQAMQNIDDFPMEVEYGLAACGTPAWPYSTSIGKSSMFCIA